MEEFTVYHILGGIILYFATGLLLDKIEQARGKRFAQHNVIFFFIIFALAMLLSNIINPPPQSLPPRPETGAPAR